MVRRRFCYEDVLPFTAMVAVECTNVGLNTIFKAAASKGMSRYVFVFYAYAIATLVLFPIAFIFHRTRSVLVLPPINLSLLCRIFLLGVIGFSAQTLSYKGIEYSSPTLASAMSNLTLTFTFILAIIFRMEVMNLRSWSSGAKLFGAIVSISDALVVVLYKGSTILLKSSSQTNWVIGGLLLATAYLLYSIWYILQTQVVKMYPSEIVVAFLYNLFATIISAPVCLMIERDPSAWKLTSDMALVACVYAGFFGSCFSTVVHSWGLHLKGPVYLAIFRPLSIAIAAVMGVMFLGDALHLGCVVGTFAVLWGKATEEKKVEEKGVGSIRSSSDSKTPFLEGYKVEQT